MDKRFDFSQAAAEADRCLLCHDAPCSKGCPANTDPGKFIRKFKLRNIKGAIRTIKENNIMGGACGVLCPTAKLCEKECCSSELDRPIRIGKIQEFLVRHGKKIDFQVFEKPEALLEKVAVIGSGPAGLSCGAELAKKGYQVIIFEKRSAPGGVLNCGVPSYRFDKDLLALELDDIKHLGVKFECNCDIKSPGEAEDLLNKGFKAVFIATGLWDAAAILGNPPKGVYNSVEFLEASNSEQKDILNNRVKNKKVAVIGGGSVAMDCAGLASKFQASDVYLVYRRSFSQMPAEQDELFDTLEDDVHFMILNQPKAYITDEKGMLTGIRLIRTKLLDPDDSNRRSPVEIEDSQWVLDVDLVVEAIGNKAFDNSNEIYPSVDVSDKNLIKASLKDCKTSNKAIFAGGDIVRGPSLVVNAVQDGKTAADAIDSYLKKGRGSDE
jgi:dihydropyrimidine dehydrogenase (NAD+) subunit PreT